MEPDFSGKCEATVAAESASAAPATHPRPAAPSNEEQPTNGLRNRRIANAVSSVVVIIALIACCAYANLQHNAYDETHLEQACQAALAANPAYIGGTNEMNHSQTVQLTGTVRYVYTHVEGMREWGYVCYLELPADVTVGGSQYGPQTSRNIVLEYKFSKYDGKTITISSFFTIISTGTIPSAAISSIHAARGAEVVRVW